MPSPFPGMDPYLEGYLWPDVHQALAAKIRQHLTPLIRPRYAARLALYVVEDTAPEGDIGIMYPDVEILLTSNARSVPLGVQYPLSSSGTSTTPATLTIPVTLPTDVQITNIEIVDSANNQLITSIEILSPVNKREPGLVPYRSKRQRLYQAGIHILELDFLRRGTRPITHPQLQHEAYIVALTRAQVGKTQVWSLTLQDALPIIPVPLRAPDNDVTLDLGVIVQAVYDEAAYDLSIDYQQDPPPPSLSDADRRWIDDQVKRKA